MIQKMRPLLAEAPAEGVELRQCELLLADRDELVAMEIVTSCRIVCAF